VARRPGILVVEDDDAIRTMLQKALPPFGYAVWTTGSGEEAVELYRQCRQDVDLVLLDVQMPVLDGPETLVRLRQLNPALCCCFFTGGLGHYTVNDLLILGAARVLRKPISLSDATALFRQLLAEKASAGP